MAATIAVVDEEGSSKRVIHINVPARYYLIPGTAFIVGTAIGLMRGGQRASLRFLAENAHRPPTTVQGWYFYNKTKNYRVLLGGLKAAGAEAGRLTVLGVVWVGVEEGMERAGWGGVREMGAGVGTAGMCSAVYRMGWRGTQRAVGAGMMIGASAGILRVAREGLARNIRTGESI